MPNLACRIFELRLRSDRGEKHRFRGSENLRFGEQVRLPWVEKIFDKRDPKIKVGPGLKVGFSTCLFN